MNYFIFGLNLSLKLGFKATLSFKIDLCKTTVITKIGFKPNFNKA